MQIVILSPTIRQSLLEGETEMLVEINNDFLAESSSPPLFLLSSNEDANN